MASLDFSVDKPSDASLSNSVDINALVDRNSLGTRSQDGLYEIKDWEFTKESNGGDIITRTLQAQQEGQSSSKPTGTLASIFARLTGSMVLTETDLKPTLEAMKQHLMKKNVAKEIAERVCEGVGESLVGKKVGSFQSERTSHVPFLPYTHTTLKQSTQLSDRLCPCRLLGY